VFHGDGSVRHPGLDNHAMGTIFEELIRRFNEENNEEAGEHWTPRDAVRLMANLIFLPVADQIESGTYLLCDCACGTGGMLTVAEADWEKLSIFLNFLIPKLPAPKEEDLSRGIIETIDMDSYRVEKKAAMRIALPDRDAEIGPVPTSGGARKAEPELELLSNILRTFNDQFGNIEWADKDRVHRLITEDIPARSRRMSPTRTPGRTTTSRTPGLSMTRPWRG
jgi:hypothetical protein